jgi:hypothetical protein
MSSLQKFHRRTASFGPITWPATAIGGGDETHGYWLGDISSNKIILAPKSTEVQLTWGSYGIKRGPSLYPANSLSAGLTNTNTLYAFGSAAHPAAYYAKTLTLGGYNTWYLPAQDEIQIIKPNRNANPFATSTSAFGSNLYWGSTEWYSNVAIGIDTDGSYNGFAKSQSLRVRAIRRTAI